MRSPLNGNGTERRSPPSITPAHHNRHRNGSNTGSSSSKATFVVLFFTLWIIVSIAILVRYDFYSTDAGDAIIDNGHQQLMKQAHVQLLQDNGQGNVEKDKNDNNGIPLPGGSRELQPQHPEPQPQPPQQLSVIPSGQQAGNGEPVLVSKTYTRRPENVQWQRLEASKVYPGSSSWRMHGDLHCSKHFEWQDSLKHPLSRNVTDIRPEACKSLTYDPSTLPTTSIVIIFCNEDMELLLRSVHSVLDRTPPSIVREIVLVDDFSDDQSILPIEFGGKGELQQYIAQLTKVRYVRLETRGGIVGARVRGIEEAKGDVFVILDSHIEVVDGWLEPLLKRIDENPRTVVMPVIDGISPGTWIPQSGGIGCVLGIIWKMIEHAYNPDERNPERHSKKQHEFITSPTMAGGLFGANTEFFLDLGGYDLGMTFWGTENLELSFRIWQCGGSLECTECSHVHHLFGGYKRYSTGSRSTTRNKMRTMAVWMDQYADLAWRVMGSPVVDIGDIAPRLNLRNDLQCRDFQWFLDNVWPESDIRHLPEDVPYMGAVKNVATDSCLLGGSLGPCANSELMYFKRSKQVHLTTNDETCLTLDSGGSFLKWDWCSSRQRNQEWNITNPGQIRSDESGGMCIAVRDPEIGPSENNAQEGDEQNHFKKVARRFRGTTEHRLTIEHCRDGDERQIWEWTSYSPPLKWNPPKLALRRGDENLP